MSELSGGAGATDRPLRVVYFGMTGAFSIPPFEALLSHGVEVRAVALPALAEDAPPIALRPMPATSRLRRPVLPLLTPYLDRTVASLAAARGIPVYEVALPAHPETLAALDAVRPDAIVVACFPRRLPLALLALPRLGCLNLHPSLLPDNRGPDPLFWTFHRGDRETGITLHRMDERLDTGPILAQQRVDVPPGIGEVALERELATHGGALLIEALGELAGGRAHLVAQDERLATSFPWPTDGDFVITPSWSARRAFAFAAGVAGRARPVVIDVGAAKFAVREPLEYDESAEPEAPWRIEGDTLSLRCSPGVLRARVTALGRGARAAASQDPITRSTAFDQDEPTK